MARLVRTQVEMEGRYEDRWTLVEDDTTPEYDPEEALAVVGHPHTRVSAAARVAGGGRRSGRVAIGPRSGAPRLR